MHSTLVAGLVFMAAALLWLAARAYRGIRISSTLTLPLMFFTVACFLSVLTSQLKGLSAVEFSRILSVVVMAIVLERLAVDPPAVKRIMFAAMGSALIPLLASLGARPEVTAPDPLGKESLSLLVRQMMARADKRFGGFGAAPKFPTATNLEAVLAAAHLGVARGDALEHLGFTLERMARGGIYDQLGGGFHRYSVDERWLVPHFEKMLYDNGQLASLYLHGWLALGDPECRRICEETLDYILREMTDPSGGFYSSQDADSEGHEGKFFVWTADELREILGEGDAEYAARYWGMDRGANFEGKSILYVAGEPDAERIAPIRAKLYAARERRIHPGLDDKVLASWNGLACRALAEAGRALGRADYVAAAVKNAGFLLESMRADGRLLRTWKGGRAKLKGYLEDYSMVTAALLEVYEATFDRRWLDQARTLATDMVRLFWDEPLEGFYDTGSDGEPLIVRPRNLFDNAVPCGASVAIEVLFRLTVLTGEPQYEATALKALRLMGDLMAKHPSGFGRFLCALDFHLGPVTEIALVAPKGGDGLVALETEVFSRYLPNRVVTGMVAGDAGAAAGIPLLEGREAVGGKATAYVCRNYACELPVTDRAALARQLQDA
jgi:uncharacterized protein YyaL (SSP411 family)